MPPTPPRGIRKLASSDSRQCASRAAQAPWSATDSSTSEEAGSTELQAGQAGRSREPISASRAAQSPPSAPVASVPRDVASRAPESTQAKSSSARLIFEGGRLKLLGSKTKRGSQSAQSSPRSRDEDVTNFPSQMRSLQNPVSEGSSLSVARESGQIVERNLGPKRKVRRERGTNTTQSDAARGDVTRSSSRRITTTHMDSSWDPYLTVPSEQTGAAVGRMSGSAVPEGKPAQPNPGTEAKRRRVISLLRDGASSNEIEEIAGVSKHTIALWKAEAIEDQTLDLRTKSGPLRPRVHDRAKQDEVQALVHLQKSVKKISEITGVSETTIHEWKSKGWITNSQNAEASSAQRDDKLAQVYSLLEEGKPIEEIAELTSLPKRTLYNWRLKGIKDGILHLDLHVRQHHYPETRAEVFTMLEQGIPVIEITKKTNVPGTTISTWRTKGVADGELNADLLVSSRHRRHYDEQTRAKIDALLDEQPPKSLSEIGRLTGVPYTTVNRWSMERKRIAAPSATAAPVARRLAAKSRSPSPAALSDNPETYGSLLPAPLPESPEVPGSSSTSAPPDSPEVSGSSSPVLIFPSHGAFLAHD